jgi:hypothetical protein
MGNHFKNVEDVSVACLNWEVSLRCVKL